MPDCRGVNKPALAIEMPKASQVQVRFENHRRQLKAPCIVNEEGFQPRPFHLLPKVPLPSLCLSEGSMSLEKMLRKL